MPLPEKLVFLLRLLEHGVENKKLSWEATPSEDMYRMELPGGPLVRIRRDEYDSENQSLASRYILSLHRRDGRLLDEWISDRLGPEGTKLNTLFGKARKNALDVDTNVEQILHDLQKVVEG